MFMEGYLRVIFLGIIFITAPGILALLKKFQRFDWAGVFAANPVQFVDMACCCGKFKDLLRFCHGSCSRRLPYQEFALQGGTKAISERKFCGIIRCVLLRTAVGKLNGSM